jgi:hypothetical protein
MDEINVEILRNIIKHKKMSPKAKSICWVGDTKISFFEAKYGSMKFMNQNKVVISSGT